MLLAGVMLISGLALASNPNRGNNITLVTCTGTPTDRTVIQSAVNNAASGDVLMLVNTCQLDGTQVFITKSNLTITGAGRTGNWSTVVQGIADGGGHPVGDNGSTFFNRGFQIGNTSGNSVVRNVEISNIKFSTLHRSVLVSPQLGGNSTQCNGFTIGNGSASSIVVANNWFDNDDRAAQTFGTSTNVSFQNNLVTNTTSNGVDFIVEGQVVGCGGGAGFLSIGVPTNSAVAGNSVSGGNESQPIIIIGADKIAVTDNGLAALSGLPFAMIQLSELSNSHMSNNQIDGNGTSPGIAASDFQAANPGFPPNSFNDLITNNIISNGVPGVGVDSDTTGYSVVNNQFVNSSTADIVLCGSVLNAFCDGGPTPSFQNKVVTTNFGNSVIDSGTNNQLLGTQNLINNTSVPAGVRANLIGGAVGKPQS